MGVVASERMNVASAVVVPLALVADTVSVPVCPSFKYELTAIVFEPLANVIALPLKSAVIEVGLPAIVTVTLDVPFTVPPLGEIAIVGFTLVSSTYSVWLPSALYT